MTTATASANSAAAGRVIDTILTSGWNAGAFAPQWVEIDLGAPMEVSLVRMLTAQTPAGNTVHEIYAGSTPSPATLVRTMAGATSDGIWLTAAFSPALTNIRHLRVKTTVSPSWVAWREIEVYGPTMNKIATRSVNGIGEFYDTVTGLRFTPRGNNYVRLAADGTSHATFASWDPGRATSALGEMKYNGYNVVRVFINDFAVGNPSGPGLNPAYLNNVKAFLDIAYQNRMYVLFTLPAIARQGGYWPADPPDFVGPNALYLSQAHVDAKIRYVKDFITGLQARGARMDAVFGYCIQNEVTFDKKHPPLSYTSGSVTPTNNGLTYDMAVEADRQQMLNANLVQWINKVRAGIHVVHPGSLVGPSFFSPSLTPFLQTDEAKPVLDWPQTFWAINDPAVGGSSADFVSLHVYPGLVGRTAAEQLDGFHIPQSHQKPLVMGEFGAYRQLFGTANDAGVALKNLQVLSCNSYHVKGWLTWTWDTAEQTPLYNAKEANGIINAHLTPFLRGNPCVA